jgi:hypothetical protein
MMPAASAPTVVVAATAASHMTMTMTALYEDDAIAVGQHIGFATGIADADKMDVVISTHVARLIKSSGRIGPSLGRPRPCGRTRTRLFPGMLLGLHHGSSSAFELGRSRLWKAVSRKQNAALLGGAALPGSSQTRCQIERISRDWRLSHHSGARQINGPSSGGKLRPPLGAFMCRGNLDTIP